MKTFCILEQGSIINEPLTLKKKKLFTTEFSDFYRLNWKNNNDPNAFITQKNISWSEGRSFLYEKVPKNYKYYIFLDDDIDFYATNNAENISLKIKQLLETYQPLSATFFDPNRWKKNDKSFPRSIDKETYLARKVFPIAGFDPQAMIFSQSFADVVFPVIYHGGSSTLRYSNWICYHLFPLKQMCFSEIQVTNTRADLRYNQGKKNYTSPTQIRWLFNKDIKDKSLIMNVHQSAAGASDIRENNLDIFNKEVDIFPIEFTLEELGKIYNINNLDFKNRKSIIDNSYIQRSKKNNTFFLWFMRFDSLARKIRLERFTRSFLSI